MPTRPLENSKRLSLTSALPVGDEGNFTLKLNSAMGVTMECTAASSGTGTFEVQFYPGGDWHPWKCFEYASGSGTFIRREAAATITLADNDILFSATPGCYQARFNLGGTSVAMQGFTCSNISDELLEQLASGSGGAAGESDPVLISIRVLAADNAQANVAMVTVSAGTIIGVKRYSIKADGSNTAPYNFTLGFAAATLATPNTTSGAGILEDFLGISAGQGVAMGDGGSILGWGASGEDLRYSCEDPEGGAMTCTATYVTKAG